ncbi:hypothetical protein [Streptomyces sp. NPDC017991]|uniref:hypothetical protein n=1 Tax=Streptomyces sp. NPDC017991 TaxID=3365026 RepID=UPI0037B1460B
MTQQGTGTTADRLIADLDKRRTRNTRHAATEAEAGRAAQGSGFSDDPQDSPGGQDNALLDLAHSGGLTTEHLRRMVGVEAQCQHTELAAFALMASRFPHRPAADLYDEMAGLVRAAQPSLADCAKALGMSEHDFRHGPRTYRSYAFGGMLSWIALQGSQAATALALHTDLTVYLSGCAELVRAIREADIRVPDEFLRHYGTASAPELLALAVKATDDGLRRGDDPATAVLAAWLLERSLSDFWRAAAEPAAH